MIEIKDLSFSFNAEDPFIKLAHLTINPGEHIAILGPSGSGKSSLLRLLCGLLLPNSGEILIDSRPISPMTHHERKKLRMRSLHYLSQEGNLLADLSLRENLTLPLKALNMSPVHQELDQLCEELGIQEVLNKHPRFCSGGEQQKASLARALIHPSPYILADEPTSHLSPEDRNRTLQFALEVMNLKKKTLVMVTHNHEALDLFPKKIESPFLDHLEQ
jgi:ABC-type lipoprotein export system ATPase subunit